jgi:hypothetical protein
MPYVYQLLTIKPTGEKWYAEVEPVKHADYMKWVESYPGLISVKNVRVDESQHIRTLTFTDQTTYNKYVAERNQRQEYIERQEWMESHGFIAEVQVAETN